MGRGSSGAGRALSGAALVEKANAPINEARAGASYRGLSKALKESINKNLQLSKVVEDNVLNGNKYGITDEWTTGFPGDKVKLKIITDVTSGRLSYTVKQRNKILLKTSSKEQTANKVAQFYIERQEEMRKTRR